MSLPKKTTAWRVTGSTGFDCLKLQQDVPLPELGDHDCLVKISAASLNYRDLIIPKGTYPFPMKSGVIPGSDGAGTILATGAQVTRFQVGDRVCTTLNQGHLSGSLTAQTLQTSLGGSLDGTFRQHGVFHEDGLVAIPKNLSFREAASLPCAAVTAWNALYGLNGRALRAGDTVLTLGTGGVSLFAVQFAVAAGALVIATTSSKDKATKLKELGAKHVINYRESPNWGEIAKSLTPGQVGVDFIVEVGGSTTLGQSLEAAKIDGVIAVVGFIGGDGDGDSPGGPRLLEAWLRTCIVRGVAVGSRDMFEDMNRMIEACEVRPVVVEKVWKLEELKEAYQFLWDQKNFGKVVVECQ